MLKLHLKLINLNPEKFDIYCGQSLNERNKFTYHLFQLIFDKESLKKITAIYKQELFTPVMIKTSKVSSVGSMIACVPN